MGNSKRGSRLCSPTMAYTSYRAQDILSSMNERAVPKKAPGGEVTVVAVPRTTPRDDVPTATQAVRVDDVTPARESSSPETKSMSRTSTRVTAYEPEDKIKRGIRERRERNERFDAQRYSANQWERPLLQAERLLTI